MKILIVDDSKAMRLLVKRTLRLAGFGDHDTLEATNGSEAIGVVQTEKPDLVLSDWNMPEMTGIQLLRSLREQGTEVQFGFVTTEASDEMRAMATEAGASFFITKPFTPESIEKTLAPVIS